MSDPKPRKTAGMASRLLGLCAGGLALATLAGCLGRFFALADLFSHFVLYYTVASAGVLALALVLRCWRVAGVALLVFVFNGWGLLPIYLSGHNAARPSGPVLRLAQVNLLHKNRDHVRALDFIRRTDVDVMFLQEIDPWWERVVRGSDVPYRFVVARPAEGSFGIAMLVHNSLEDGAITIEGTRVIEFANGTVGAERPGIEATLMFAGQRVKVLSIHPPPPTTSAFSYMRDAILLKAKAWADAQTDPHVIIGDLNTTPWSHAFTALTDDGKLISTQGGFGNQGTWPTHLPAPWLLPIDHCVYSPQWVCVDREIGPETGSDHLPLLVSLALAPPVQVLPDIAPDAPPDIARNPPADTPGPGLDSVLRPNKEPAGQPATIR
ncbi:MAG: endonuclease/exonuclease/phosphatase family protein [Phycisphaerales bacterium]